MANQVMQRTSTYAYASTNWTKILLLAGVASGPFFYVLAILQMLIRPGFDIRIHAISLLLLGDLGWIQSVNFIATGVLVILCAIGLHRILQDTKAGSWGPLLIIVFGVGSVIAGIFHPDPGMGFPPGAPAGIPTTMSTQALVHTMAFNIAFLALIVACFVFVRRFLSMHQRGWALYCAASGVLAPVFIVLGLSNLSLVGLLIAFAGAIAFGWVSVLSAGFLFKNPAEAPNAR